MDLLWCLTPEDKNKGIIRCRRMIEAAETAELCRDMIFLRWSCNVCSLTMLYYVSFQTSRALVTPWRLPHVDIHQVYKVGLTGAERPNAGRFPLSKYTQSFVNTTVWVYRRLGKRVKEMSRKGSWKWLKLTKNHLQFGIGIYQDISVSIQRYP